MALAWRLWRNGEGAAASPFAKWRLLDLEASLRRCQSRFGDALRLLDDAMVAAPEVVRGRILLKKAYTYEQAGEIESALTVLQDAAPRVEAENDRGLDWALAMNRVVLLAHLGRFGQAEYDLAKVQRLAVERGNRLDVTRVLWLTARVSAGLGRSAAARDAWAKARQEFIHRGTAIDAALVTLELSVFDLNERQPVDWIGLEEAVEIFRSSGMARETIAARSLLERRPHPRPVR
jgi:tetratricopeptide (TPR) repeat protein